MRYYVTVGGQVLEADADGDTARVAGAHEVVRRLGTGDGPALALSVGHRPLRVHALRRGDSAWEIHCRGRSFQVEVADERSRRMREPRGSGGAAAAGPGPLRAPMPGLVLRVDVEEGQEVAEGQGLVIVEAMKMENELRAQAAGRIRRVLVRAGQSVGRGDVLIEFEQDDVPGHERDGSSP